MKFKNWQRIYVLLLWISWISVAVFLTSAIAIEGLTGSFDTWYGYGMTISVFPALASILIYGATRVINPAGRENKKILKDFGTPESKEKIYYWYDVGLEGSRKQRVLLFGQSKKIHEFKFTPKGIFVNTHWFFLLDAKEQILLWEDVEKVSIERGALILKFRNTQEIEMPKDNPSPDVHSLSGLLYIGKQYYVANKTQSCCYLQENEVFLKLIQTFYEGEIVAN